MWELVALLELDPDRRMVAYLRVVHDWLSVDPPVHDSSFGRWISEDMIELIRAAAGRGAEESSLFIGEKAGTKVTRPGLRPDLAEPPIPAGEPWDVVHARGAVQIAAPDECLIAEELVELEGDQIHLPDLAAGGA